MTDAALGYGATFSIKTGGSYVAVAEVVSLTPPSWTRDTVDGTHLQSPDKAKEYIGGLTDLGEATLTINYKPAASDALLTAFTAETGEFRIIFPGGTVKLDFDGIVTAYEPGELVSDGKMSATFTVKATGSATFSAVTP